MNSKCKWNQAWIGICNRMTVDSDFCGIHKNEKCVSCGKPATHDCDQTGQFVCGASLCNDCEHTIFPEGHNGGIGFNAQPCPEGMERHCKKTEQKYKPWYQRETENERQNN